MTEVTLRQPTTNRRKIYRQIHGKRPSSPLVWKGTFLSDSGHGWLRVPRKTLYLYGLENEISRFSYVSPTGTSVYLEEDSDAGKLISAIHFAGDVIHVNESPSRPNRSHVRSYPHYPGATA